MSLKKRTMKKLLGFSTIEALIAVLVVSVGALAVSAMQGNLTHAKNVNNQRNEAQILSQQKMEELRNFDSLSSYDALTSGQDSITSANTSYTRAWTVTTNANPNYKTIQLTISWQSADGNNDSITLSSSIARHDPKDSGDAISSGGGAGLSPDGAVVVAQEEEEAPAEESPSEISENVPDGAVDNGDGTSTLTVDGGTELKYDNSDGDLLQINNVNAVQISGSVTEASGSDAPPGSVRLTDVTINPTSDGSVTYCTSSITGDTLNYNCVFQNTWSGSINLGGVTNTKVCVNSSQPYSNVLNNLFGQDFQLFKSSKSCSGSTPTFHQSL